MFLVHKLEEPFLQFSALRRRSCCSDGGSQGSFKKVISPADIMVLELGGNNAKLW
jgi:hypothetical protein